MFLIYLLFACDAKLVYFTEVCRHGARAPKHFMPWDSDERWPNGAKNLVNEGLRQHYLTGLYLRKRYITDSKFLSDSYNSTELKVYSTSVSRTILSMESQLLGLYPPKNIKHEPTFHSFGANQTEKVSKKSFIPIFLNENKIEPMLLIEDYCKPYNENVKLRKSYSQSFHELKTFQDASAKVESYFKSMNKETVPYLLRVFGSAISNRFMGYSIPEVFDDRWFNETQHLHIKINEFLKYENKYSRKLAGSEFLNHLLSKFEEKIEGKKRTKAVFYSAHDTTLMNIFATLNVPITEQPPFASILIFELHETENKYFIKTIFNDSPLILSFCSSFLCEFSAFKSFVLTNTFKNSTEACINFPSFDHELEKIKQNYSAANKSKESKTLTENEYL